MASMLNVLPTSTQGGNTLPSTANQQTPHHYRTSYGSGGFQTQNSLSLQTAGNFKRQNYDSNFMVSGGDNSSGSRIKVAVRVRPLLEHEKQQGHQCTILKQVSSNEVQLQIITNKKLDQGNKEEFYRIGGGDDGQRAKNFKFDQVFSLDSTQSDLYTGLGISNMVSKVIEGYHSTIFAYGQTGSGKTFTMEGYDFISNFGDSPNKTKAVKAANDSDNIGIIQRSIFELFNQIQVIKQNQQSSAGVGSQGATTNNTGSNKHYSVFCSFLQIYNEKVFDLLNSSSISSLSSKKVAGGNPQEMQKMTQGLRIRWTKKDQFVVENLYVFECQTPEEAIELFRFGSKNRVLASHNLNDLSSRSHTIFTLTVESQDLRHGGESITVSKLQLVDLAGSEKQGLTGTTGQQAKESIDINKSLLVLRKVITALTEQKGAGMGGNSESKLGYVGGGGAGGFIPYRESKLTCLLKQSLGGNSYTLMIACLSPSDRYLEENLSTLNYAAKASLISNIPTKNIDPRLLEINEYKKKIYDLEKELRNANDHIQFLTQMNDDKAKKLTAYETQLKLIQSQDPTLLKTLQTSNDNATTSANSKLPQISIKNSSQPASSQQITQLKQLKEGMSKEDMLNLNLSEITQADIDLNNSGIRSIISPNKSAYSSNQQNVNVLTQSFAPSSSVLSNSNSQLNNQKRQTQMNFFLQKDKEKQDAAAERLIHSVNAVTDLLKANTELRDTIEKLKNQKEEVDSENFSLQIENQSLRERLELVEGILKNNKGDYDGLVSDKVMDKMMKSNTQYGKFNMNATMDQPPTTIDAVYTELIQLRHKNKALEGRIKQLEIQNFRMTNQGFNKNQQKKLNNQEPLRPMFRASSIEGTPLDSERQVQEETDEDDDEEDDYDEEVEGVNGNAQGTGNVNGFSAQYHTHQPTGKSRSFIVTIDEHNPQKQTGLIKKRIIKKSAIEKQRRINPNQIVMARGDPYLKKLAVQQTHLQTGKSRDQINNQLPPPSSSSQVYQKKDQVPDQRFYTKTNFFTVTNNQLANEENNANRTQNNISAFSSEKQSPYQNQQNLSDYPYEIQENVGGAVQAPKNLNNSYQQAYESDFNTLNDGNRRNKVQLEPINEHQLKNITDVEFKNFQKMKKQQQQMKSIQISAQQNRDNSSQAAGNLSMVMVMSNLMSKRSGGGNVAINPGQINGQKKKSQSQSSHNKKKQLYANNDFYF